ncbi:MAG: hypothetical protein AAF674_19775 [Pseudomonadota bacterium]
MNPTIPGQSGMSFGAAPQSQMFNPAQQMTGMPQAASPNVAVDLTHQDFGSSMGGVTSSGDVLIQFSYENVLVDSTNPEEPPTVETRLCVTRQPIGDRLTQSKRYITSDEAAQRYPEQWALFQRYQVVPTTGLPLHELPGITQSQIAILVLHGVRSVEDLVNCGPDVINQIGMEANTARGVAVKYMKAKEDNAEVIDAGAMEVRFNAKIEQLERQLQEALDLNKGLLAQQQAMALAGPQAGQSAQTPAQQLGGMLEVDAEGTPDPELKAAADAAILNGPQVVRDLDDLINAGAVDPVQEDE